MKCSHATDAVRTSWQLSVIDLHDSGSSNSLIMGVGGAYRAILLDTELLTTTDEFWVRHSHCL